MEILDLSEELKNLQFNGVCLNLDERYFCLYDLHSECS